MPICIAKPQSVRRRRVAAPPPPYSPVALRGEQILCLDMERTDTMSTDSGDVSDVSSDASDQSYISVAEHIAASRASQAALAQAQGSSAPTDAPPYAADLVPPYAECATCRTGYAASLLGLDCPSCT